MYILNKFIAGNTIKKALKLCASSKFIPIFDLAKEAAKNKYDISKYTWQILQDIDEISKVKNKEHFIALKISSFYTHGPDINNGISNINLIIKKAQNNNIKILIDAEQHSMQNIENLIMNKLVYKSFFKTYQMYKIDSISTLVNDINNKEISNFKIVRGAYMNQDKKLNVLLETKENVDKSYDKGIHIILESMKIRNDIILMAATHNNESVYKILKFIEKNKEFNLQKRIYFAQLLGMADSLTNQLIEKKQKVCKYVPYGKFFDTMPYLSRRLYENYDILKYI
jgi:proline dehydrogenase